MFLQTYGTRYFGKRFPIETEQLLREIKRDGMSNLNN